MADQSHTACPPAESDTAPSAVELTPRERGFVARIMAKYPGGQAREADLYRSLAIFTAMVAGAHLIEQFVPTWWLPLVIIYPPAVFLFSRYRKFGIFRSCVISKLGARLTRYEPIALRKPGNGP
ncbi:MAG: hypothetical protein AMXMBFR13_07490 [Phycisphaerae bacterium]